VRNRPAAGESRLVFARNKPAPAAYRGEISKNRPVFHRNRLVFAENKPVFGANRAEIVTKM